MGGFCHHEGGPSGGNWCGGLTCTNPETGRQVGFPECCNVVAEGCGGIATLTSNSTDTNFGTGKPVGSDVEIAVLTDSMVGADGSKTTDIDSVGELGIHLAKSLVLPILIMGGAVYVILRLVK